MNAELPERAAVVVVGGGVIGCSIAYHLARLGITDVLLLERHQLASGTSWHAAGLFGQLRATRRLTELARYGAELFPELERESGQATGFAPTGSISLALNRERLEELRRDAAMARSVGIRVEEVVPREIHELHPLLCLDGVLGGLYIPEDGTVDPVDLTRAYAYAARRRGVRIAEGVAVERILTAGGRVDGVWTSRGPVRAERVVLAAGLWTRLIARTAGVAVPLYAAEHVYLVTEPLPELTRRLPVVRIPDECAYVREDAGKLLLGFFEPEAVPIDPKTLHDAPPFLSLPGELDRFSPLLEQAVRRIPPLARAGIKTVFNGPESFTPDNRYLLGETAEVRGLFVACGMNSIGIQSSAGIGRVMAEWIRDHRMPVDLLEVDVQRFHPVQTTSAYLRARVRESLGRLYALHMGERPFVTARGVRRSPFHARLCAAGAVMAEEAGFEHPDWFREAGCERGIESGEEVLRRCVARECRAAAEEAALFEASHRSKLLLCGPDAASVLDRLCTARMDVAAGSILRTLLLERDGGIAADLIVWRLEEDRFLLTADARWHVRNHTWLRRNLPKEARAVLVDADAGYGILTLVGPRAPELLARIAGERARDVPAGGVRRVEMGCTELWLGFLDDTVDPRWQLLVPADRAPDLLEHILEEGKACGLRLAGARAERSLAVERGEVLFGRDVGPEVTPLEAGLEALVAWDKNTGFPGADALLARRRSGPPRRRLVFIRIADGRVPLYGEEPIWQGARRVGRVTSGAFGHRLGASLGLGYVFLDEGVEANRLAEAGFEVEVAGARIAAELRLEPFLAAAPASAQSP